MDIGTRKPRIWNVNSNKSLHPFCTNLKLFVI